jgi:hypothetical protein
MPSEGEVSFDFNFIPTGDSPFRDYYSDLKLEMDDQEIRARRIVFPTGETLEFDAFLTGLALDVPTGAQIKATAKFQVTGEVGAITAPGTVTPVGVVTWNPEDLVNVTLSLGNLRATGTGAAAGVRANSSKTAGKYYFEISFTTIGSNPSIGLARSSASLTGVSGVNIVSVLRFTGNITVNGVASGTSIGIISGGAVVCVAVNLTTDLIWFRPTPAGNWNGSALANPATGIGGVDISSISAGALYPIFFGTSDVMMVRRQRFEELFLRDRVLPSFHEAPREHRLRTVVEHVLDEAFRCSVV